MKVTILQNVLFVESQVYPWRLQAHAQSMPILTLVVRRKANCKFIDSLLFTSKQKNKQTNIQKPNKQTNDRTYNQSIKQTNKQKEKYTNKRTSKGKKNKRITLNNNKQPNKHKNRQANKQDTRFSNQNNIYIF